MDHAFFHPNRYGTIQENSYLRSWWVFIVEFGLESLCRKKNTYYTSYVVVRYKYIYSYVAVLKYYR